MTELNRRDFMIGTTCALGAAVLPGSALERAFALQLEDWIGRDFLARVYELHQRLASNEQELDILNRYSDVKFEEPGRLYATPSLRSNLVACVSDRTPRIFPIRLDDLLLFVTLVRAKRPALNGLAGIAARIEPPHEYGSRTRLLVAPLAMIEGEQAKHPEVVLWSQIFYDDDTFSNVSGHQSTI